MQIYVATMRRMRTLATAFLTLTVAALAHTAPVTVEPKDQPVLDAFLAHARSEAKATTAEKLKAVQTPETFCWIHLPKLNMSLTAYELTGNAEHLTDFVFGFENLRSLMTPSPADKLGWYGKPIPSLVDPAKPDAIIAEIQTEFRAIAVLSRFAALAKRDPAFAAMSDEYLTLSRNHLLKKWDDYYHSAGDGAAVYRWNVDYIPTKAGITLSHEKQAIMIEGLLNLYRATGNRAYSERAEALGKFLKRSMREDDGRYVWNFWDLGGDLDREEGKPDGKIRHWIGPEPQGVWYAVTVGSAVLLYHHGLVFDETDIAKLRKTQMEVCWNGDLAKPVYKMVDGRNPPKPNERFVAPSLAPWEPKLAELLYSGAYQDERIAKTKDAWHGGVIAGEWLRGKYLILPTAKGGKRLYVGN
jgi:hypothetical protein